MSSATVQWISVLTELFAVNFIASPSFVICHNSASSKEKVKSIVVLGIRCFPTLICLDDGTMFTIVHHFVWYY